MSRPHVLEFSQPGRSSTDVVTCSTGLAAGLITTRLYGPPRTDPGDQAMLPSTSVRVQNAACAGYSTGGWAPGTTVVVTGNAPVPMSTEPTVLCGTPDRYAATAALGPMPTKAGPFAVRAVNRSCVSPIRVNGASERSSRSTSWTTTAYPGVERFCSSPLNAPPWSRCCKATQRAAPATSAGKPMVSSSIPRIVRNNRICFSP
ncbi:hypothetical protein HH310_06255 [Actinoplanes sp. TBRC 11911]|uniref:hypothetical protein n=1 Tax=Actinoplanes sp. TBRC 11911 TaxID=2729386 RepID=UPI00145E4837|nr:hypothetical protein [Actinoplanes sp. TBRC 11911]NMO50794.1 hypothetical protein [Actinoplanes sp. TBRC 11911]